MGQELSRLGGSRNLGGICQNPMADRVICQMDFDAAEGAGSFAGLNARFLLAVAMRTAPEAQIGSRPGNPIARPG